MKKYDYKRSHLNTKINNTIKKVQKFEWKYRNLILLFISIVVAFYILKYKPLTFLILEVGYFGYLESFILGMLFTYALTVAPTTAALFNLGQMYNPILIALVGAFGSVLGNYLLFKFVRNKLADEIKSLAEDIDKLTKPISTLVFTEEIRVVIWRKVSRSRMWKVLIPVIAGFILASPLPDEIGVALFGASKFELRKFLILSYSLHFIGILFITSLAKIV